MRSQAWPQAGARGAPVLPGTSAVPGARAPTWAQLLALAAAYVAAGKLGLSLAVVHPSASAVWAPTGIALAALLLLGKGAWPAVFAGAFLVNVTTAGGWAASLGIAAGNTLEGLLGALLVSRYAGGWRAFETPQNIFRFAVLAALAATAVSATVGVTSLCLGGYAAWAHFGPVWLTWWLGDAGGALVVAPLLVLWAQNQGFPWRGARAAEAAALLLLLCLSGLLLFGGWMSGLGRALPLDFLCVPFLVWAAYRFGPRETATALFLIAAMAVWGTLRGYGPFAAGTANESLLVLQGFLALNAVMSLAFAALVSERVRAETALRRGRDELEARVERRTEALSMANEKLREEVAERRRIEDHLRRREEELRERGDQLSRANADLGLFAFLVSHELQEPVRKTVAFGELLARAEAGTAQERQPHIRRMQDAARRMQRLVNDIMSLCRVTAADKPLEPVDLDAVVGAVAEEFGPLLSRAGGKLRVEPLPRIRADPSQMRALFTNLVSNAHKFRSKDRPPLVSISAGASEPGFVDIVVADNGIGFEERYRERIFKPFERLHRKGEYEGSGMGLAICERILMRHGGNIKAESRPGEGSRFIVTLPA